MAAMGYPIISNQPNKKGPYMAFNLDDYEPVASRVQRFYDRFPNGAIHCDLVYDDGQRCVIKATVYRDAGDNAPSAIDYAEEILTDKGVNSTSRIENCATSAVGRAISIAAGGFAPSDPEKKPTREEMEKVQRMGGERQTYTPRDNGGRLATVKQVESIQYRIAKLKLDAVVPPNLTFDAASAAIDSLKNHGKLPVGFGIDVADDYDEEEPF